MQKIWTVLMVNHCSWYYFIYQLKILYKNNDPSEFQLLIIDNSPESEVKKLEYLSRKYKKQFHNIQILYYTPTVAFNDKGERDEHGETVNFAMQYINTKYLVIHDPDFFWVKKGYLKQLESVLNSGHVAVGAPYPTQSNAYGDPNFPAAFGCAYNVESVRNIDFMGEYLDKNLLEKAYAENPLCKRGESHILDMGYKVRMELSNFPHSSFEQKQYTLLTKVFGKQSITVAVSYYFNGKIFAFHLFGGSRKPNQVYNFRDKSTQEQLIIFKQWKKVRYLTSKYFYLKSISEVASITFLLKYGYLQVLFNDLRSYTYFFLVRIKKFIFDQYEKRFQK